MNEKRWALAKQSALLALLVAVAAFGGNGGNRDKSIRNARGCILGSDSKGIATITLKDLAVTYLLRNNAAHTWLRPVWCQEMGILVCMDTKTSQIVATVPDSGHTDVLYTVPKDFVASQLAVMNRHVLVLMVRREAFLPLGSEEWVPSHLVSVDIASKQCEMLVEAAFDWRQPPQPVGDNDIYLLHVTGKGLSADRHIAKFSLKDHSLRDVLPLPANGFFRVGSDGNTVVIMETAANQVEFSVGSLKSRVLRKVAISGFSAGCSIGDFSLVGASDVVFYRDKDALAPVGLFGANLESKRRSDFDCRTVLLDIVHVPAVLAKGTMSKK